LQPILVVIIGTVRLQQANNDAVASRDDRLVLWRMSIWLQAQRGPDNILKPLERAQLLGRRQF
jgi:hypothetical protein